MPKDPGTPDGVGLIHMPLLKPTGKIEYEQIGGFGPVSREEAFAAIKLAGNIGHIRPDTIWIQKGSVVDRNLSHAIEKARATFRIVEEIVKDGDKANEGWGIYYKFGRSVIVEHTSDPNSVVVIDNKKQQLPHFHIEVAPVGISAATGKGFTFKVNRVERLGSSSPLTPAKAKLNHHLYYLPFT